MFRSLVLDDGHSLAPPCRNRDDPISDHRVVRADHFSSAAAGANGRLTFNRGRADQPFPVPASGESNPNFMSVLINATMHSL